MALETSPELSWVSHCSASSKRGRRWFYVLDISQTFRNIWIASLRNFGFHTQITWPSQPWSISMRKKGSQIAREQINSLSQNASSSLASKPIQNPVLTRGSVGQASNISLCLLYSSHSSMSLPVIERKYTLGVLLFMGNSLRHSKQLSSPYRKSSERSPKASIRSDRMPSGPNTHCANSPKDLPSNGSVSSRGINSVWSNSTPWSAAARDQFAYGPKSGPDCRMCNISSFLSTNAVAIGFCDSWSVS